jgi:hypothetical protein
MEHSTGAGRSQAGPGLEWLEEAVYGQQQMLRGAEAAAQRYGGGLGQQDPGALGGGSPVASQCREQLAWSPRRAFGSRRRQPQLTRAPPDLRRPCLARGYQRGG